MRLRKERSEKEKIKPLKCDKCRHEGFLRVVGYSDNGEFIEEWYSDEIIKCEKCGHPLHQNKYIIRNKERVRIPILSEWISELIESENAKKEKRPIDLGNNKRWEWFVGKFRK